MEISQGYCSIFLFINSLVNKYYDPKKLVIASVSHFYLASDGQCDASQRSLMNTFTRCQWCPLDQYLSSKYIYAALTLTFGNFYWSGEQSLNSWHDEPSSWVGRYIHQFKNYSHRLHPPTIFGVGGCIHQL